jgi:Zn-dependent protease/CBS domain-containing protein
MDFGGIKLGTVRGIPIRAHFTLFLALPLVALGFSRAFVAAAEVAGIPADQVQGSPWLWGAAVAVALFGSVLVHELAHSLYALRTGGAVREITLLMIGGVSQMSRAPQSPRHEALMAAVGPAVSLGLGALFYLASISMPQSAFSLRFALFYLGSVNFLLGAFNMLPAFPMDGGRVLRAVLTGRLGPLRATRIAAQVGKAFAVLFGLWGLASFNMFLMLIAFFVWLGAEGELQLVVQGALFKKLKVRDVMNRDTVVVMPEATVREVVDQMRTSQRLAFVLTPNGLPLGLLTLDTVRRVPPEEREQVLARDIAVSVPIVSPADTVASVLPQVAQLEVAVMDTGGFLGTVGREDLARALRFQQLEEASKPVPPPWWGQRPLGR